MEALSFDPERRHLLDSTNIPEIEENDHSKKIDELKVKLSLSRTIYGLSELSTKLVYIMDQSEYSNILKMILKLTMTQLKKYPWKKRTEPPTKALSGNLLMLLKSIKMSSTVSCRMLVFLLARWRCFNNRPLVGKINRHGIHITK